MSLTFGGWELVQVLAKILVYAGMAAATGGLLVLWLVLATVPLWIARVGLYPYLGIEMRQDGVADAAGQQAMAAHIAHVIRICTAHLA